MAMVSSHASQGGHKITLTWRKKNYIYIYIYIYLLKKKLYAQLTNCDHPNKNVENPDLRIIKFWVQQK